MRLCVSRQAYHASLDIVEREMQVILNFLANISTVGALLAGFVWNTLSDEFMPEHMSQGVEILFTCVLSSSFGAMLYSVITATVVQTLGPAMALKGKDGTAMRCARRRLLPDETCIVDSRMVPHSSSLALLCLETCSRSCLFAGRQWRA